VSDWSDLSLIDCRWFSDLIIASVVVVVVIVVVAQAVVVLICTSVVAEASLTLFNQLRCNF